VSDQVQEIGTAEAKRRFSELADRVEQGERFVISRRGRPVVALVSPEAGAEPPRPPVKGLAALAGAMADWEELDDLVAEIYAARDASTDRPAPDLG